MATEAHFLNTNPITDGLKAPTPFNKMEEALTREIAKQKVRDERVINEARRVHAQSDEIK